MEPAPPPPPRTSAPQARAVVVLTVALVAMLLLWAVGTYVLLAHTPDFGEPPGSTPTPSAR